MKEGGEGLSDFGFLPYQQKIAIIDRFVEKILFLFFLWEKRKKRPLDTQPRVGVK